MPAHPPQLPTDAPRSPAPRNLKRGALFLLLAVAVVAAAVAFLLPTGQPAGQPAPTAAPHRVVSPAYQHPAGQ